MSVKAHHMYHLYFQRDSSQMVQEYSCFFWWPVVASAPPVHTCGAHLHVPPQLSHDHRWGRRYSASECMCVCVCVCVCACVHACLCDSLSLWLDDIMHIQTTALVHQWWAGVLQWSWPCNLGALCHCCAGLLHPAHWGYCQFHTWKGEGTDLVHACMQRHQYYVTTSGLKVSQLSRTCDGWDFHTEWSMWSLSPVNCCCCWFLALCSNHMETEVWRSRWRYDSCTWRCCMNVMPIMPRESYFQCMWSSDFSLHCGRVGQERRRREQQSWGQQETIFTLCRSFHCQGPRWMLVHHFVKPLTNDFVLTWWGGVELARRMLLLLFIVAFPDDNVSTFSLEALIRRSFTLTACCSVPGHHGPGYCDVLVWIGATLQEAVCQCPGDSSVIYCAADVVRQKHRTDLWRLAGSRLTGN